MVGRPGVAGQIYTSRQLQCNKRHVRGYTGYMSAEPRTGPQALSAVDILAGMT